MFLIKKAVMSLFRNLESSRRINVTASRLQVKCLVSPLFLFLFSSPTPVRHLTRALPFISHSLGEDAEACKGDT